MIFIWKHKKLEGSLQIGKRALRLQHEERLTIGNLRKDRRAHTGGVAR